MGGTAAHDLLQRLLQPVVAATGCDLDDLTVSVAGRRRVVRVVVDRDGGVSLDDVAAVSTALSAALDAAPEADRALGGASYVLEVSSPGVDRPLTQERHWRRAVGRLVTVHPADGPELTGRVTAVEAGRVTLLTEAGRRDLDLAALGPGRVQVEFSRPGAAGDPAGEEA